MYTALQAPFGGSLMIIHYIGTSRQIKLVLLVMLFLTNAITCLTNNITMCEYQKSVCIYAINSLTAKKCTLHTVQLENTEEWAKRKLRHRYFC